jgi:hypothetical protein
MKKEYLREWTLNSKYGISTKEFDDMKNRIKKNLFIINFNRLKLMIYLLNKNMNDLPVIAAVPAVTALISPLTAINNSGESCFRINKAIRLASICSLSELTAKI